MADSTRPRLFVADGKVRGIWRILLFLVLFALFVGAAAGLIGGLVPPGPMRDIVLSGAAMLVAALAAGWLLLARLDRRPPGALGFAWTRHTPRELGLGLAIPAFGLAAVTGGLALAGLIAYEPDAGTATAYASTLLGDFLVLGLAAAAEEALFRGYAFQVLVEGTGAAVGTLVGSMAFAAAHATNPNVGAFALFNIFLAGILLSIAYLRTRSLWFATAVHLGWNWTMASVFDLPVSGLELFDTPLYEPVIAGPAWITGGVFGPEGGLAATLAFLLMMVAVVRAPGLDAAPEARARRPLVEERV